MSRIISLLAIALIFSSSQPKKLTWVAIGDSITYLNDHADETGNRLTSGYMTQVTEQLPDINVINKGYNGWTSGQIAAEIDSLDLREADIYTVLLGTNDWWAGRPVGTMEDYEHPEKNQSIYASYRIIINKLRKLNPGAKIILMTPLKRGDFVYLGDFKNNAWGSYKSKNGQWLSDVAEAIVAIGKREHISVVDLYQESGIEYQNIVKFKWLKDPSGKEFRKYTYPDYIGKPFNPETDEYPYPVEAIDMTYDGLHPSNEGCKKIADLLVNEMKTL